MYIIHKRRRSYDITLDYFIHVLYENLLLFGIFITLIWELGNWNRFLNALTSLHKPE